ncbi:MAG: thymidylate synthase [archaeon]
MSGLPVLSARGESIPEAWENSILELHENGQWYKRGDPQDNEKQVDASMLITIENPDADLFMHKYMTCGIEDLVDYEMEIHGVRDSWEKDHSNPEDNKWDYTYHGRLTSYPTSTRPIDQLRFMINRLSERPFSRRVNAITWVPEIDTLAKDTPCLQRIGLLITPDAKDPQINRLNMTYNFRSRNAMIAAPMNIIGFYALQCTIRNAIREKTEMKLENGRIVDFTDSYHVSTRDQGILKNFMGRYDASVLRGETIRDRALSGEQTVFPYINSILSERTEKIIEQTKNYLSGEKLDKEITKIRKIAEKRKR